MSVPRLSRYFWKIGVARMVPTCHSASSFPRWGGVWAGAFSDELLTTRRDEPIAGSSLRWHLHFTRCLVNSNELSLSLAACTWRNSLTYSSFYGSLFLMRSGISVSTCSLASLSAARPTVRPRAKIRSSWDRTARLPFTGELNCKRSSHLVNNLLHLIVSATNYSIPVECWKEIGTQNPIQMQMETTRMATRSQRRPAGRSTGLT